MYPFYTNDGQFGPGSGPVHLSLEGVACDGTESSIQQCGDSQNAPLSCDHSRDVGVRCENMDMSGNEARYWYLMIR